MTTSSPVLDAIDAACGTMGRIFDENGMPRFAASVWPVASLEFDAWFSEGHVPGRYLNALLLAESIGRPISEAVVDALSKALFFSYGGGPPLPLNRAAKGATVATNFAPHNLREGFHGLHALARYRQDSRALAIIGQSVAFLLEHWDPADGWDERVPRDGMAMGGDTVAGVGRALGPLVKILDLTGDETVRRLVDLVATTLLTDHFLADGEFDVDRLGRYSSSATSSLSSLAQYAAFTGDRAALDAVKAFYDNGAWSFRDDLGWVAMSFDGPGPNTDLGAAHSTGELLETALILADDGDTRYLDDAERMIFAHLLPSQVRDVALFSDDPDETLRDLAGSWGFPAPYGHLPVGAPGVGVPTDIVGGTTSSLCAAVLDSVRVEQDTPTVRLYLDIERHGVRASLDGSTARVSADARQIAIRIPRFDGTSGGYVSIEPQSAEFHVPFPLERTTIVLRHPEREIRARMFGSRVEAMDSFGMPFAFFPPL